MDTIYYMWNFKTDEKQKCPPNDIIQYNTKFIKKNTIIRPDNVTLLLDIVKFDNNEETSLFNEIKAIWELIPHWIIKADLGRLIYIYFAGNIYLDVDCIIIKSFTDQLKDEQNILLFTEKILTDINLLSKRECKNPENVLRVANYAFGANCRRHPFLMAVISECLIRLKELIFNLKITKPSDEDILWTCGPDVITCTYHKYQHKEQICLLDETYLVHYCAGSWRAFIKN